jgi:uncharacterized membrane protein
MISKLLFTLIIVTFFISLTLHYNIEVSPFSYICHQKPDRCPYLFNFLFPICWRCCGSVLGFLIFVPTVFHMSNFYLIKALWPNIFFSLITFFLWKSGIDIPSLMRFFSGLCISASICITLRLIHLHLTENYKFKSYN